MDISRFHIKKEKVNSISFIKLIKKYSIKNLDLLMIDAEGYDGNIVIDFLSNGFKWRDNNAGYNSSATFIWIAFAEAPFKYANAR